MARIRAQNVYKLTTVEFHGKWNRETQTDNPPPETTDIKVFRDESDFLKDQNSVVIPIPEGSYIAVIDTKVTKTGSTLVYAFFTTFGGWAELNPKNWKKIQSKEIDAEAVNPASPPSPTEEEQKNE